MNLLQIISGVDVNGALVYCKLLTERLQERGHRLIVAARPQSWIVQQNLTTPFVTSSLKRFPLHELNRFRALIAKEKIDLIHTHMSRASHFGVCLNLLTGVPVIASAHHRQWQLHWRFNNHVIANSDSTAQYMRRVNGVSTNRLSTVHCFIDLERFRNTESRFRDYYRTELHMEPDDFLIGVVGDVTERKGQEFLIKALPQLIQRIPQVKIAFIGRFHRDDTYAKKLRRFIKTQRLFCRVKWLGIRRNVHEYMQAFDALCVPSIEEPLGMVAIEGQAAGIPVAASNTGGLSEIIRDRQNGWLFEPHNPDAIADCLFEIFQNRHEAERRAQFAREDVAVRFCPDRLTDGVERVYEQVLSKRGVLNAARQHPRCS